LAGDLSLVGYTKRALRGAPDKGASWTARLSSRLPESRQGLFVAGMDALESGDAATAARLLAQAYRAGQVWAAGPLGLACWQLGQREAALEYLAEPQGFAWLRARSREVPDGEARVCWLELAVAARPDDVQANNDLSWLYAGDFRSCGGAPECMERLERAMSVRYPSVTVEQSLVRLYIRLGRKDDALTLTGSVLQRYAPIPSPPYEGTLHSLHAEALLALGRYSEAVVEYRAALALVPGHESWGLGLAKALAGMGE